MLPRRTPEEMLNFRGPSGAAPSGEVIADPFENTAGAAPAPGVPVNEFIPLSEQDSVVLERFFEFIDKGDEIEGIYLGFAPGRPTKEGEKAIGQYWFRTPDGLCRVNSLAGLQRLRLVPERAQVRVVYDGEEKRVNGAVKQFRIIVSRVVYNAQAAEIDEKVRRMCQEASSAPR